MENEGEKKEEEIQETKEEGTGNRMIIENFYRAKESEQMG